MRSYYVYILTNRSGSLYLGVTSDLPRRIDEHRRGKAGTFTARYKINLLMYLRKARMYVLRLNVRSNSRAGHESGRSS
jgi:predicted GIY-YIG superfamily endonuclease